MASVPLEGWRDLRRRVFIAWYIVARFRVRRALCQAETELGWLGWEQVDFYDEQLAAHAKIVQDFEHTQASLINTSAELSGQQAKLDEQLAAETAAHEKTQAALAAERAPLAAQIEQAEASRRLKTEATARFDRAIAEISRQEKELESRSIDYMRVDRPDIQIRMEARRVSDELARLSGERQLVLADQSAAAREAAVLEASIIRLRAELQRIDATAAAARETLAAATRRHVSETRHLDRQKKKGSLRMAHLDREKRSHYRIIGAALADEGITPLNQPEVLTKVLTLRERDLALTGALGDLLAACATVHPGTLIAFYILLFAILFTLAIACAIAFHLR